MSTVNQGGRGSNFNNEDRKRDPEHSHSEKGSKDGRGSNVTTEDRKKGGQPSHGKSK